MKKILIVTEYPRFQPQAMVRAAQYEKLFDADPDVSVRFITYRKYGLERFLYFADRITGGRKYHLYRPILDWVARRSEDYIVRLSRQFDVVYIVKVRGLSLYQRIAAVRGCRMVMDFGDALWMPSHQGWGWKGVDEMLRLADRVVCENAYVRDYAADHNSDTRVIGDAPQVEDFDPWRAKIKRNPEKVTLGWIGTCGSVGSLFAIWEVLERLFQKYLQLELRIVGAGPGQYPNWEFVRCSNRVNYQQKGMIEEVLKFDIGLFPHFDVVDARARGSLKAKIYMAGGTVAVCQDIGENRPLIKDGINGVLCADDTEWFEKLEALILDREKRDRIAAAGLEFVRQEFGRAVNYRRLKDALVTADAKSSEHSS